jgi:hypothetical protein
MGEDTTPLGLFLNLPHLFKLTVGSGDPGADLYTSPGDPAFYLHHGQIDRLWDFW